MCCIVVSPAPVEALSREQFVASSFLPVGVAFVRSATSDGSVTYIRLEYVWGCIESVRLPAQNGTRGGPQILGHGISRYRTMLAAHHIPPHALCSTADLMNSSHTCVPVDRGSLHREYSNLFSLSLVGCQWPLSIKK